MTIIRCRAAIFSLAAEHQKASERIMRKYRGEKKRIIDEYNEATAARKLDEARSAARSEILVADSLFAAQVREELEAIRCSMIGLTAPDPKNAALTQLDLYNRFGVKPTVEEMRELARNAGGNLFTLRALAVYGEQHGYNVTAPTLDDYYAELRRIEEAYAQEPLLYTPDGYEAEALEIMPDVKLYRPDGTVYANAGRPDATTLITRTQHFKTVTAQMNGNAPAWGSAFVPQIEAIDPKQFRTKAEAEKAQEAENQRFEDAIAEQVKALNIAPEATVTAHEAAGFDLEAVANKYA